MHIAVVRVERARMGYVTYSWELSQPYMLEQLDQAPRRVPDLFELLLSMVVRADQGERRSKYS
eukprot:5594158-Amphidinium_carterae.3